MNMRKLQVIAALLAVALGASGFAASADEMKTYEITVKDKVFTPNQITVKAGEPFRIKLKNANPMPVELESSKLGFEKVAAGFSDILVNVRAQAPGTYTFFDDFHPKETTGQVVVQ
ncbi:cupredoxin domain-containing protein [Rhizobium sp. C4]|uniref:cupredoxin domain-containing protein n=1 Tax=Rhizobium sp. C4 TaxID=1349800 RepID=UPI001E50FCAD|nr:cupredoxin domain-containing protein [Rhizobium sp. C4]MCD2174573.1 cupredoxin domain-containing protein [Rhizobium sp. C4]